MLLGFTAAPEPERDVYHHASSSPLSAPTSPSSAAYCADAYGALVLDRPEKLNPLSSHTLNEIEAAARWFDTHDRLKVVVVSGFVWLLIMFGLGMSDYLTRHMIGVPGR
jgi:hypothetical protein